MAERRSLNVDRKTIAEHEVEDIEKRTRLRARVIYEIVRLDGQTDMSRPTVSLWWSGVAAGLSLSFSLLMQAILFVHLPDSAWRPLVAKLGYTVGFLIAVLSRYQLFTETTITVILPLFARFNLRTLKMAARMWAVVLAANIFGTFLSALFFSTVPIITPHWEQAMVEISRNALAYAWWPMLCRGIGAGFLMAALVWLMPSATGSEFQVVLLMTYLIALGDFAHVVAGSVEGFMLVLAGAWTAGHFAWGFVVPAVIGNAIGGTALVALISYAQVKQEL